MGKKKIKTGRPATYPFKSIRLGARPTFIACEDVDNMRQAAYDYGKRRNMKFRVQKAEGGGFVSRPLPLKTD